jgi:SAM-dependent methyltransferase
MNAINTVKYLGVKENSHWLDLGCGHGHKLVNIFPNIKPASYVGVDIDSRAIKTAYDALKTEYKPIASFFWTDLNRTPWFEIPYKDHPLAFKAEIIVCIFSWQYQEKSKWLEEIRRSCPKAKQLILKIIDCEELERFTDRHYEWKGPDGTWVKVHRDTVEYNYPWKEGKFVEPFLSKKQVIKDCNRFGWSLDKQNYVRTKPQFVSDEWIPLVESAVWLKFKKD